MYYNIRNKINALQSNDDAFFEVALDVYKYQIKHNSIFRRYVDLLGKSNIEIHALEDFCFLPIENFKHHQIATGNWSPEVVFESSGTTGMSTSKHFIKDTQWYLNHAAHIYESFFSPISETCIIGLLPGYLERTNSSLVSMVQSFIQKSDHDQSGFYLDDFSTLSKTLLDLKAKQIPTVVFGVSFALLDFAREFRNDYSTIKFVETGGMKGRGKELTRDELHGVLKDGFNVDQVYSEYGMTELLSQSYFIDGSFSQVSTMRVLINEVNDPFKYVVNQNGQINIIDLVNIDSCSFIQTGDIGRVQADGRFNVLGRLDDADIRGCNLMYL